MSSHICDVFATIQAQVFDFPQNRSACPPIKPNPSHTNMVLNVQLAKTPGFVASITNSFPGFLPWDLHDETPATILYATITLPTTSLASIRMVQSGH